MVVKIHPTLATVLMFSLSSTCFAGAQPTAEALMASVIDGTSTSAEGEVTGDLAQMLKAATHSTAKPRIRFENLGKNGDCFKINQTLTVPDVPSKDGKIVGDWVNVTRINLCKDGKNPPGLPGQELISCRIGKFPCPPQH